MEQQTFGTTFQIDGIGLHSGQKSTLSFHPACENTGIVFRNNGEIKALYTNVSDTKNCTCLKNEYITVNTIEHLMSALYISEIDNVIIDVSNPELPIMDGSAKDFLEIFENMQKVKQNTKQKILKVKKSVRFGDDKGNYIELNPSNKNTLHVYFEIEFPSEIVGRQVFDEDITYDVFKQKIAMARTFCEKYQIDYLRSIGLIKGGSLENAVVLDGEKILNPEGFRIKNECVGHKVLDLIGDMYTSGYRIISDVKAYKTGHYHNNEILKKLFESKDNYDIL